MLKVYEKEIIIPTYPVDEPEKVPIFLNQRVYQASSGKIYPYPLIEKVFDDKIDNLYNVVIMENDFIKVMLMPSIGGRIQYGYDKINDYYFFYNNEVIKPALVGLAGPWISGGVEFNWPQHHRPSTFDSLEYIIETIDDTTKIVWMGEIEQMSQMIGQVGIKLYENSNRIEIIGRSINTTKIYQNFLWWSNIAVHVHDNYSTFFPLDVKFVADHGKREIASYPFCKNIYYNVDYQSLEEEKQDIAKYKNIPVPMSYMAIGSKFDFFGGYDFDRQMGTLQISNHHVTPGKKQWTWGNENFGQAWEKQLTDNNGPYIEIMSGAYTDNQPDFTWIAPHEMKQFKQVCYPFKNLGKVKNASDIIAIQLDYKNGEIYYSIYATEEIDTIFKIVYCNDIIYSGSLKLGVGETIEKTLTYEIPSVIGLGIIVDKLLSFTYEEYEETKFQEAIDPKNPQQVEECDELVAIGIHLDQYRHATRNSKDYYFECLNHDPSHIQANIQLGLLEYKNTNINEAIRYFTNAIIRQTKYNHNPVDTSAFYYRGLCYKYFDQYDLAYKDFYKAIWDYRYKSSGYLELAKIDYCNQNFNLCKEHINESLKYNQDSYEAIVIHQLVGNYDFETVIKKDKFNYYALYFYDEDKFLNFVTYKYKTILKVIEFLIDLNMKDNILCLLEKLDTLHPMYTYIRAYIESKYDLDDRIYNLDYVFCSTLFEEKILMSMISNTFYYEPLYLLANLKYDKNNFEEAFTYYKKAYEICNTNYILTRTLGLAYANIEQDYKTALKLYKESFHLEQDPHILYELDQLMKLMNIDPKIRLDNLNFNENLVKTRGLLYLEYCYLHSEVGLYKESLDLMLKYKFHPIEGAEGKVVSLYKLNNIELAKLEIKKENFELALRYINECTIIPENLGEDFIYGSPKADLNYYYGIIYEGLGNIELSTEYYLLSATEEVITSSNLSYKPEQLQLKYFQALSYRKLKQEEQAIKILEELLLYGNEKLNIDVEIDYFAISIPELLVFNVDLNIVNKSYCNFLIGISYLGLDCLDKAKDYLDNALIYNINNIEARIALEEL